MIRFPPPPVCFRPVVFLRGHRHRPGKSHFLGPPKLVLEGVLLGRKNYGHEAFSELSLWGTVRHCAIWPDSNLAYVASGYWAVWDEFREDALTLQSFFVKQANTGNKEVTVQVTLACCSRPGQVASCSHSSVVIHPLGGSKTKLRFLAKQKKTRRSAKKEQNNPPPPKKKKKNARK